MPAHSVLATAFWTIDSFLERLLWREAQRVPSHPALASMPNDNRLLPRRPRRCNREPARALERPPDCFFGVAVGSVRSRWLPVARRIIDRVHPPTQTISRRLETGFVASPPAEESLGALVGAPGCKPGLVCGRKYGFHDFVAFGYWTNAFNVNPNFPLAIDRVDGQPVRM